MAKKFFKCLSLLMILTLSLFGTAAAKSQAEITGINAYDINDDILRIEIAFNGALTNDEVTAHTVGNILSISMENTTPGRISKVSGTKIDNNDFVKKITVKEIEMRHTRIRVTLSGQISDDNFKYSVQPASKPDKKSARVVIDVMKSEAKDFVPEEEDEEEELPVLKPNDKVVVLDAGHGGSDAGAIGPRGVTEKSVALAVALKAEKILQDEGMKVIMTRRTDVDVAAPGASNAAELQARVDKVPPQADIFISIHCNAFSNPASHGMETYYFSGAVNPNAQRLARLLNEELAKYGGLTNRGVKAANFYVLKRTRCPASLIELGFITNAQEEKLLADEKYQNKLAAAIASAVKKFFMN